MLDSDDEFCFHVLLRPTGYEKNSSNVSLPAYA